MYIFVYLNNYYSYIYLCIYVCIDTHVSVTYKEKYRLNKLAKVLLNCFVVVFSLGLNFLNFPFRVIIVHIFLKTSFPVSSRVAVILICLKVLHYCLLNFHPSGGYLVGQFNAGTWLIFLKSIN